MRPTVIIRLLETAQNALHAAQTPDDRLYYMGKIDGLLEVMAMYRQGVKDVPEKMQPRRIRRAGEVTT